MQEDPDFDRSDAAQKRLRNKRRGGDNNAQGNRYEEYFALAEIVRFAAERWDERGLILFSEQAENAFVDDLKVIEPACHHLYQLKSGQVVAWGDCSLESICGDFYCQACQERRTGHVFQLHLVVAQEDIAQTLDLNIPLRTKPETHVRHFPLYASTIDLLKSNPDFNSQLQQISRGSTHLTDLDALAKLILGNWAGSTKKDLPLSQLLSSAQAPLQILIKSDHAATISPELEASFRQIDGFEFSTSQGLLKWNTQEGDSGVFPYLIGSPEFSTWEEILLQNPPQDFETLEPLLDWIAP